ncbi:ribbon-helix-helix protein, CopG family, partial [Brachybacterium sp. AOP42-B2-9]|uniref:ribbon-helix-helix protein, CopG family n=3 Tax=Dermabacteraceae TaxID=85020 RepID=UPI0040336731
SASQATPSRGRTTNRQQLKKPTLRWARPCVNIVYMSPNQNSFDPHRDHRNGIPRVGYKVVSARMDDELVHELDALARHTGRSRGFYLRAALQEMLPVLKERYWHHDIKTRQAELNEYNHFMEELGNSDS